MITGRESEFFFKRNESTHICISILCIKSLSLTGLGYFLLERLNTESDERQLEKEPLTAIFLSSITFTNHFEFKPQTHPARLLSFSWTLWALIIASAYTGVYICCFLPNALLVQGPISRSIFHYSESCFIPSVAK